MATGPRVRRSLRVLERLENRKELDNLIRAFRGIQQLPPEDPNSFFVIAGYHGEPFVVDGKGIDWGGYCFHNAVLFPTWHRAYCLRIENALRSIPGCGDVTLPYWDELLEDGNQTPVPPILTSPTYVLDNETIPNPLFSYSLPQTLVGTATGKDRYTKHKGYSTVRFPLSGLVGDDEARDRTKVWNEGFPKPSQQLNWNIRNWLIGKVDLDPVEWTGLADTFSVISRIRKCLDAPNWTIFSNKASATEYAEKHGQEGKHWVVSIEEPHNAIHLALGGIWQPASGFEKGSDGYNANPRDFHFANGDMGCNETAAFDPIFFIHHCFIDYATWAWQKKHKKTKRGSLDIDPSFEKGTTMKEGGNAALPEKDAKMEMTTPLKPFKKPNSEEYYTSDDVTDIAELGYTYELGSFEKLNLTPKDVTTSVDDLEPTIQIAESNPLVAIWNTATVDVNQYSGSFVIRTYAEVNGKKIEIGRDSVLSRFNRDVCGNCQNTSEASSFVPIQKALAQACDPEKTGKFKYEVEIQHLGGQDKFQGHGIESAEDQYIEYEV